MSCQAFSRGRQVVLHCLFGAHCVFILCLLPPMKAAPCCSMLLNATACCGENNSVTLRKNWPANRAVMIGLALGQELGRLGAEAILAELEARGRGGAGVRVLTHCNTGSLATAGYGTALGVVRALAEAGRLERAYCTETRPYNQGALLGTLGGLLDSAHEEVPCCLLVERSFPA